MNTSHQPTSAKSMMDDNQGDLTRLMGKAAAGDREAHKQFWAIVYDELRRRARACLKNSDDGFMESAELVGSLFDWACRTGELGRVANRHHFYARAASKMRCLLLDYLRKRNNENRKFDSLDPGIEQMLESTVANFEDRYGFSLQELNLALRRLRRKYRRQHEILRMYIWLGLRQGEIADALGISRSSVEREWRLARARLYDELSGKKESRERG